MLFRSALLSVIVANAAANPILSKGLNDIPATSDLGNKLLSKSRLLNDNNNDEEEEFSWVAGYSLKFERCLQSFQYGYNNGGDNDNGGDGSSPVSVNRLVEYRLCPAGSCSSACENGAAYVVGLDEFIQIYVEYRRESQEQACEAVRENCYCNNDDQDACEQQCFEDAGLDFCVVDEDGEGGEEDADMYTQCVASERQANENNNGNNRNRYYRFSSYTCYNEDCTLYVGPYCSNDGLSIYLGAFIDETCSFGAPPGTYESYNFGKSLPYSYEPLVGTECISCNITRDDENGDGEEEVELNEMCAELYEGAIKCEENLTDVAYPDTAACYYIKEVLPAMTVIYAKERASYSASVYYSVFGFGAVAFAALSHRFYSRLHRGARVNLSDQGIETGVAA